MMPTRPWKTQPAQWSISPRRVERLGRDVLPGDRQDAHGLTGERLVLGNQPGAGGLVQVRRAVWPEPGLRTAEQDVGCTLDVHAHHIAVVVEGGHELVGGVERDLGDPRAVLRQCLGVYPALGGQGEQGTLSGIADQGAIADTAVVAEGGGDQQGLQVPGRSPALGGDGALRSVALAADRQAMIAVEGGAGGHLVEGQGAGLVRADHRGAAEGLDGRQLLDNGPLLGHALHPQGEGHRDHRGQPLRDGGDRQGDGGQQGLHPGLPAHQPKS
jgi:hypothetical protein